MTVAECTPTLPRWLTSPLYIARRLAVQAWDHLYDCGVAIVDAAAAAPGTSTACDPEYELWDTYRLELATRDDNTIYEDHHRWYLRYEFRVRGTWIDRHTLLA